MWIRPRWCVNWTIWPLIILLIIIIVYWSYTWYIADANKQINLNINHSKQNSNFLQTVCYSKNHVSAYHLSLSYSEAVFSYKLRYIVGFWLVEMAISTNQKPTIYRSLYENTDPQHFRRDNFFVWFLSQFSTDSYENLQALFSIDAATTLNFF